MLSPLSRATFLNFIGLILCLAWGSGCASQQKTLPNLIVQRLGWMDDVAQVKQAQSLPIHDPVRETALLQAMTQRGQAMGIPAAAVRGFFEGQMEAARVFQQEWLRIHSATASKSGSAPSLTETIRPALDDISQKMLTALLAARSQPNAAALPTTTREGLKRAGYSEAVILPAVRGLEAGLH